MDEYGVEATAKRMTANMQAIEQAKPTVQEIAEAMYTFANAAQQAWEQVTGSADMWELRIDGPVYRQTFILGRFRWYRRFRVWLLRRSLH